MTIDKFEIYNRALEKYGFNAQRLMLVEECGELLNAISKISRNRATKEDVITELADVHIMVEQMAFFFGWDDFVDEKLRKLIRLDERMVSNELEERFEKQGVQKSAWSEEDERLRKTTIAFLKDFAEQGYENAVECIAWLEKQGKLKSSKWTEGDVVRHGGVLALVTNGRKAMKSNCEQITIQYPDEWVKAETKERKYFFDELEKQVTK